MTRYISKRLFVIGPKPRSPGKGKRRATRVRPAPPSPFETISEREQREIDLATRASVRSEPTPRQAVTAPVNDGAGPSGLVGPAMRYPGGGSRSKDRRRVEKQTISYVYRHSCRKNAEQTLTSSSDEDAEPAQPSGRGRRVVIPASPVKNRKAANISGYCSDSHQLFNRPQGESPRRLRSGKLVLLESDVEAVKTVHPRMGLAWMDKLIQPRVRRPKLTQEQQEKLDYAKAEKRYHGGLHRMNTFGDLERRERLRMSVGQLLERDARENAFRTQERIEASRAEAAKSKSAKSKSRKRKR